MKQRPPGFPHLSKEALRAHFAQEWRPDPEVTGMIGSQFRAAGLATLELAKLHERFLVMELLPVCAARKRTALIRHAGNFSAAAIAATGAGKAGAREKQARGMPPGSRKPSSRCADALWNWPPPTSRLAWRSSDAEKWNQFARELHPAALEDLGLIPALHSFMTTARKWRDEPIDNQPGK